MRIIAYLTMADMGDFVTDFHSSIAHMEALGWQVDEVPWRSNVDWNRYDAVYICTPWDYPEDPALFLDVLHAIDASRALLINDLALVHWTLEKTYLRDVEQQVCDIVPSTWYDGFESVNPAELFAQQKATRIVIKPTVGANAKDTFVLTEGISDEQHDELREIYAGRAFLVQPYIESIQSEGEYSLFFFNGVYSHAIQKIPKAGDFRVQEEHGAKIASVRPPASLLTAASTLFDWIEPCPTYGRGDWVLGPDDRYLLMELELIEPSLYLGTDSGAAARFARALDERFEVFTCKGATG